MILGRLPEAEAFEGQGDHYQSPIGVKREQSLSLRIVF